MNEGVLFVVEKIQIPWTFHTHMIIISAIITICIYGILLIQKRKTPKKQSNHKTKIPPLLSIPEVHDKNFYSQSLKVLQQYIAYKYMPHNSFAHSYNDVAKYCNNKNILELYKNLEKSTFDNIPEKQNTNTLITKQQLHDSLSLIIHNRN